MTMKDSVQTLTSWGALRLTRMLLYKAQQYDRDTLGRQADPDIAKEVGESIGHLAGRCFRIKEIMLDSTTRAL